MTLGTGIAIAAIWCAIAVIGWRNPDSVYISILPAVGATFLVCLFQ